MSKTSYKTYEDFFKSHPIKVNETVTEYYKRSNLKDIISLRSFQRNYKKFNSNEYDKLKFHIQNNNTPPVFRSSEDYVMHIILPDVHIPFEHPIVYSICQFIQNNAPKVASVSILGDFIDCLGLSSHTKGKEKDPNYSLGLEFKKGNALLDLIDYAVLPGTVKNYLWGNHEHRWNRFVKDPANAYIKDVIPNPTVGLRLKERGYNVFEDWANDSIKILDWSIVHGYYLNKYAGKSHIERLRTNVVFGHTHKLNQLQFGEFKALNAGFLGDKKSEGFNYVSVYEKAEWQESFTIGYEFKNSKKLVLMPVIVQNNAFVAEGNFYKV